MSKPDDVPQDVWDEARRALSLDFTNPISHSRQIVVSVARAIQKERDRCLQAVGEQRCERGTPWDRALTTAMAAIRKGEPS